MNNFKISLAGDLGSGKSTVAKLIKEEYGAEIISAGKYLRELAESLGMSIVDFNEYQKTHTEYDVILDNKMKEYENIDGKFVLDSRLAWHFVPSSFSVYLMCDIEVSASRVFDEKRQKEEYSSLEEAKKNLYKRKQLEAERYKIIYGIDVLDMSNYDLVVDSSYKTPQEVVKEIMDALIASKKYK